MLRQLSASLRGVISCSAPASSSCKGLATAASTSSSGQQAAPSYSSAVLFIPSVVCGYLAYWQFERRRWKDNLLHLRDEMLHGEARDIFSLSEPSDYQKVKVSGVLAHDKSLFVGPRPRSLSGFGIQPGYFLITPLYSPERKGAVLVNRGWVPASWKDDLAAISHGTGSNPVEVMGVIQPSEQPSKWSPDNNPNTDEYRWVDVPTIAQACGLPADTPMVMATSADAATLVHKAKSPLEEARSMPTIPDFPMPKNQADLLKFTTMPSDHLTYAATWTALCVILAGMARHAIVNPARSIRMVDSMSNIEVWKSQRPK